MQWNGEHLDATLRALQAWFDYHAYEVGLEPEPMASALFSAAGRLFARPEPAPAPRDPQLQGALVAADAIISLLYWRERSKIEALDPHYVELLDEALRKLAPFSRDRQAVR